MDRYAWIDGLIYGLMYRWKHRYINDDKWMNERFNYGWIDLKMYERMNTWIQEWMDGSFDGWFNGLILDG